MLNSLLISAAEDFFEDFHQKAIAFFFE